MLANDGPLQPRRAAWIVSEVADSLALAHEAGLAHGRLVPENVLLDHHGQVRIIGFGVDAALHGLPPGRRSADLVDVAALLYAALTGKWAGVSSSQLPDAPTDHGAVLRPRRVRAGIPRALDALCDQVINDGGSSDAGDLRRGDRRHAARLRRRRLRHARVRPGPRDAAAVGAAGRGPGPDRASDATASGPAPDDRGVAAPPTRPARCRR